MESAAVCGLGKLSIASNLRSKAIKVFKGTIYHVNSTRRLDAKFEGLQGKGTHK